MNNTPGYYSQKHNESQAKDFRLGAKSNSTNLTSLSLPNQHAKCLYWICMTVHMRSEVKTTET